MKNVNYIIAEIYIKEENINKNIRIINSFENVKREGKLKDEVDDYKKEGGYYIENDYEYKNEEEIKKCEISLNDYIIPFSYYFTFNKIGKYQIKYSFSEYLKNTSLLFSGCKSLTNIDLSNFNTQNVKDMSFMFSGCESLTNLDLSNFNTQNVKDISDIFAGCESLTNIDLSNFNTKNVTNMSSMFS